MRTGTLGRQSACHIVTSGGRETQGACVDKNTSSIMDFWVRDDAELLKIVFDVKGL
jgi:hypothetical protein